MREFFSRFKNLSARGDTLVEVLISVAIITLVVTVGYSVANRSLSNGTSSVQRNQALSVAQGQVEQLVNAVNTNQLDNFKRDNQFCVDPTGKVIDDPQGNNPSCGQFKYGTSDSDVPYSISIKYEKTSGIFTIKASWAQSTGNKSTAGGEGSLALYYKAPGLFLGTDVCKNFDGIQGSVPNGYHGDGQGNCIKNGCNNVGDSCNAAPPEQIQSTGPPKCEIHSVVSNPGHPPGVNGDCDSGHCGSPTTQGTDSQCAQGNKPNAVATCNACYCTVTVTDWNGSGWDQQVQHYWNCVDPSAPEPGNEDWPEPTSPTGIGTNDCPSGQYGTQADGCHPYTPCPSGFEGPPTCTPIPTVNPNTGNTTCPTGYTWNGTKCQAITTGGGGPGVGVCPNGASDPPACSNGPGGPPAPGTCGNGATNYPDCNNNASSGGGFQGGCGFNTKSWYPNLAIMGLFNSLFPHSHFARWC